MSAREIKYPDVVVQLTGEDGNALSVVAAVATALRRAGVPGEEINEFRREALSGDYDNVLATALRWVEVN